MELESRLLNAFTDAHPAEVARVLESLSVADAAEVMGDLPFDRLAQLLPWLAPPVGGELPRSRRGEQGCSCALCDPP